MIKFSKLTNLKNKEVFEIIKFKKIKDSKIGQFRKLTNFQNCTVPEIKKFFKLSNLEN